MKTIRRTRIKVKRKELIVVRNENPPICPICKIPIQSPNRLMPGESAAGRPLDDQPPPLPADPEN